MERLETTEDTISSIFDFQISFCTEKQKNKGEDAVLYALAPRAALACSLDGCGGSGAKQYKKFQNKSGAYMASRVVFGAVKDWFLDNCGVLRFDAEDLRQRTLRYLDICSRQGAEVSRIKSNLTKEFPTTAAIEICTAGEEGVDILSLWAGDSRCYLLTPEGLMQLSDDDLDGYDAMENLMEDGVLTNVISASKPFVIHSRQITVKPPCVAFTATDGCFGYYTTPMEFEFLLLDTLEEASGPVDWENRIVARLNGISGDDFTLSGLVLGFGAFEAMQQAFAVRHEALYRNYIQGLSELTVDEKIALWHRYSPSYSRYLVPRHPVVSQPEAPVPMQAAATPGQESAPVCHHKKPVLAPPKDFD